jgi:hypothetical protein
MGLPLDFETFDATAHQRVLDQYELFDTVQDAACPGEYKMPESEFVTHITSSLEEHMPKFAELYHSDEMRGKAWSQSLLLDCVKGLAAKGKLKVGKEAKKYHESATKMLQQSMHQAMSFGVNDDSDHKYDADPYWDEGDCTRGGQPRYDTEYDMYGMQGSVPFVKQEFEDTHNRSKGQKGKGKGKGKQGERKRQRQR